MQSETPRTAVTIAGSDPTGGAGFQADLRVFTGMGVYGMSIPAVLTAQNTGGVYRIEEVSPEMISEQLDVLLRDISPDAIKTGMLYSMDAAAVVARKIREYSLRNLVIDPVAVSSTGVSLIQDKAMDIMKRDLFPLSRVIIPNIHEAGLFAGKAIHTEVEMKEAAVKLRGLGPEAVIITGGHLEDKARDMLFDGSEFMVLESAMLEGEYHGTGCVFSASITAGLALGYGVREAFVKAKDFTLHAMKNAVSVGKGMRILTF